MAWDKVTKVNSIAKRKPWTKSNLGKHVEYKDTMRLVSESGDSYASWSQTRGDTVAQLSVTLGKRGKLRRVTNTGHGSLHTSWPSNASVR